jgi:hypothetical protein
MPTEPTARVAQATPTFKGGKHHREAHPNSLGAPRKGCATTTASMPAKFKAAPASLTPTRPQTSQRCPWRPWRSRPPCLQPARARTARHCAGAVLQPGIGCPMPPAPPPMRALKSPSLFLAGCPRSRRACLQSKPWCKRASSPQAAGRTSSPRATGNAPTSGEAEGRFSRRPLGSGGVRQSRSS